MDTKLLARRAEHLVRVLDGWKSLGGSLPDYVERALEGLREVASPDSTGSKGGATE